jgi:hypothetical protein
MGEAIEFAASKRRVSQRIKKQKLCHKRPPLAPGGTRFCGTDAPVQPRNRTKLFRAVARPPPYGAARAAAGARGLSCLPRYNFPMSGIIFPHCGSGQCSERRANLLASGKRRR